jgi:hypothetical protein
VIGTGGVSSLMALAPRIWAAIRCAALGVLTV